MGAKAMALSCGGPQVWAKGPEKPDFCAGRVDVWRLRLDDPDTGRSATAMLSPEQNVLSLDEMSRAARFHFERDRVRFVRCRTTLRRLLSAYLNIPASNVQFTYTPRGKPEVAAGQNPNGLRFNVSHSGDLALIAVGGPEDLGIDIEAVREDVNTADLAERFFSTRERETLRAFQHSLGLVAFYACWARKESFLKAMGDGLAFPLANFSVSVHPDIAPRVEEIGGDASAGLEWSLTDLHAAEGFRSAIAVKRRGVAIATYHAPD
jgi:4'-phosphopantetheinyl transferase